VKQSGLISPKPAILDCSDRL